MNRTCLRTLLLLGAALAIGPAAWGQAIGKKAPDVRFTTEGNSDDKDKDWFLIERHSGHLVVMYFWRPTNLESVNMLKDIGKLQDKYRSKGVRFIDFVPAKQEDIEKLIRDRTVSTGDPGAGELIELEPGADPGTAADASLQIILNQIGPTAGVFEIDTACWMPANSVAYALANAGLVVPTFTKGVIELVCDCGCHADIVCDGVTDLLDVVTTVDIIFRGEAFTPESFCPYAQVDVNCGWGARPRWRIGLVCVVTEHALAGASGWFVGCTAGQASSGTPCHPPLAPTAAQQ